MPMIDIGSESYPAFSDLDFANFYLAGDVGRSTAWALKSDDAKGRGLVSATRMIARFITAAPPPDPEADLVDIPLVLQEVTAMLGADLLAKPRLFSDASGASNVKLAKAGSASVEFFQPVKGGPALPRALWDMLALAGLVGLAVESEIAAPVISGVDAGRRPLGGRWPRDDWPWVGPDYC